MKKFLLFAVLGLVLLTGCSKGIDYVGPEPTTDPDPTPTGVTEAEIKANVLKVFGTEFSSNQDWNTTTSGNVTFNINSDVKKVAILAMTTHTDENGETYNSMNVLNQAEANNQSSVKLSYDVAKDNDGLYAAFYTANNCKFKKIEGTSVSYDQAPLKTRGETEVYKVPEGDFVIDSINPSWAAQRGWIDGEKLYILSDDGYARLKMDAPAYSDEYKATLNSVLFSYFQNKQPNLAKVKASGYSDDNAYRVTTGTAPIIISPIYKCDQARRWGNEVFNSDLYYYYFKSEDYEAASDKVAFLQALPKFKLIPFRNHFGEDEDNVLEKRAAYAALYFGDGVPKLGDKGTFNFPAGYKIGFMVRAKTGSEGTKKQGELYFDGRLNAKINAWPNFKSSGLGASDPRASWFKVNDRLLLCWESGTDSDFNDIILEIEGGVKDLDIIPEFEYNSYTFCFEDTQLGDYDMNDIVIKAVRKNATTVEYSIVACGAYDNLFVKNINSGVITDDVEIHSLFGKEKCINTESNAEKLPAITVEKTVSSSFSFLDESTQPYIYDGTTKLTVKLSKKGEDPHGIMIPYDLKYPLERVIIKDAYKDFNNWGANPINSTDWYTKPVTEKVYNK